MKWILELVLVAVIGLIIRFGIDAMIGIQMWLTDAIWMEAAIKIILVIMTTNFAIKFVKHIKTDWKESKDD